MNEEIFSSILLNSVRELSPADFRNVIGAFGSAAGALQAGVGNWRYVVDLDRSQLESIQREIDSQKKAVARSIEISLQEKIRILLAHSGPYPERLRHIYSPPPVLFVKGMDVCGEPAAVAIVGSRRCTHYGEKVAARLATELSEMGVVTISGLARGIDTHAHWASLKINKPTWAVIGSGLLNIYPPENIGLSKKIEECGAVISEFALDKAPHPSNFPRRNRIIAGLSIGTVVVEGGEKSGALITARMAAEEGRDVFAVPGPITSALSAAPHRLLRLGAKMVESATDIVEEFSDHDKKKTFSSCFPSENKGESAGVAEKKLLTFLGAEPISREILAEKWNGKKEFLSQRILELELKGLIKSLPGGMVVKI